ncbi:unnamed protein product [Chrysodeixis includens]|uniref:Uncharacterized protein n=1 Tax=Chrysodeixis includens TaxID=689277 RepID=A0A9N8KX02_CHRIL|nr:unnamed protein product [Chrysodeixis includens]
MILTATRYSYATYYSAHACLQTQVHSLFFYSHNPTRRQSDTTGERSGARHTFLRAFRNTEAVIFISKTHTPFKNSVPAVEIELETFVFVVIRFYHSFVTASKAVRLAFFF